MDLLTYGLAATALLGFAGFALNASKMRRGRTELELLVFRLRALQWLVTMLTAMSAMAHRDVNRHIGKILEILQEMASVRT